MIRSSMGLSPVPHEITPDLRGTIGLVLDESSDLSHLFIGVLTRLFLDIITDDDAGGVTNRLHHETGSIKWTHWL
jgi:hypothetical protein